MGKGGGSWRDDPAKADQVVVIMSGQFCVPISWKGFFTVFQVILTSIAEPQSFLFKRPPPLSFIQEDADKKRGITITNITNCFPCLTYVHDFVRQPTIHLAVTFNLSETCGQRQPRQRTVYRSFHVSRVQRRYLTPKKKYFYTWTLGSHILHKQDV